MGTWRYMKEYKNVMEQYESTIKETSKSDENIDFIESEVKVYDFDAYTEDVCKEYRSKKSLSSVDAFALSDDDDF